MNVLFSVKVFLIFVGKDRYFILQQENIRRYCIHLYDKYKEFNWVEHFLKHPSLRDVLILLFACTYILYVAEQKKSLKVSLTFLNFRPGDFWHILHKWIFLTQIEVHN